MSHAMSRLQTIKLSERKWLERAWSDQELADELGIVRQTVHSNRKLLIELEEDENIFIEVEHGRYKLDPKKYLPNLKLNRATATIAYTLAKRLARQLPEPDSSTVSLLKDLAFVLHQPLMERLLRTTQVLVPIEGKKGKTAVFEKVVNCWLDGWVVSIKYRSLRSEEPVIHRVHPYLIEPSPWNESLYLIGKSEKMGKIAAFKLSRIEAAADTTQPVEYPDDFKEDELLQLAWGIWQGDSAETVKLRFKHGVATQRLRETKWHPTEKIEQCQNGDLIWSAQIADWQEMLPWVRGWGAACEVLEPLELRQTLIRETLALANIYELNSAKKGRAIMDIFEQFLALKGKTDPELTIFEHSSDVYHIARYLLEANKEVIQNSDLVKAGALLHDVGKIEQDIRQKQWVHQPYSAKYLRLLLDHPRMQMLLTENGIDMDSVKYDDLLLICEHHHDIPTRPDLLRLNPEALLVSVADALASSLEGGWLGNILEMLQASPYIKLNTVLLRNLDLDAGLDGEIHRIDLPADSIPNALLADLIYRDMCIQLQNHGMIPLLQKHGSLWVKAHLDTLQAFLETYTVNPRQLYQSAEIDDDVFESMLSSPAMPPAGSLQVDTMKFLLLNEQIALKLAGSLALRKTSKEALEFFNIPVSEVHKIFTASSAGE